VGASAAPYKRGEVTAVGLEPTATRLKVGYSTTELRGLVTEVGRLVIDWITTTISMVPCVSRLEAWLSRRDVAIVTYFVLMCNRETGGDELHGKRC
jgi:hypothetical protein